MDRIAEEKLKLQMNLGASKQSSEDYFESGFHTQFGKNQVHSGGFASRMMQQPQDLELRTMGPESLKSASASFAHHQQQQKMFNLNKNMANMSFQSEWGNTGLFNTNNFNPVIGSAYSPFSNATLLAQQSTQYGSNEIDATAKLTNTNGVKMQPQSSVQAKSKESPLADEIIKPNRNLSPNSIRSRVAEILDEDQVATFLTKYADVREEAELMFLAQSMKFDSFGF